MTIKYREIIVIMLSSRFHSIRRPLQHPPKHSFGYTSNGAIPKLPTYKTRIYNTKR